MDREIANAVMNAVVANRTPDATPATLATFYRTWLSTILSRPDLRKLWIGIVASTPRRALM